MRAPFLRHGIRIATIVSIELFDVSEALNPSLGARFTHGWQRSESRYKPGRGAFRPPSSTILSLALRSSASSLSLATAGAFCAVERDGVFQSLDAITCAGGFTAGRVVGAASVLMASSIAQPIHVRYGVKTPA